MGWKDEAREALGGRYIKFNEETPEHTVTFEGEPTPVEVESTFKKGETYTSFEFPVTENGKSRILGVTSKALMSLIIEEDDEESIVGRTFKIKSIGSGKSRSWKLREVQAEKPVVQAEVDDKAKFKEQVRKHKEKTSKVKSTVAPEEEGKGLVDLGGKQDEQEGQAE